MQPPPGYTAEYWHVLARAALAMHQAPSAADVLRHWLDENDISARKLGMTMGYSPTSPYIGQILRRERPLSTSVVLKLAQATEQLGDPVPAEVWQQLSAADQLRNERQPTE